MRPNKHLFSQRFKFLVTIAYNYNDWAQYTRRYEIEAENTMQAIKFAKEKAGALPNIKVIAVWREMKGWKQHET